MTTDVKVDRVEALAAIEELILETVDNLADDVYALLDLASEAILVKSADLNLTPAQRRKAVQKRLAKSDDAADLALGRKVRERLAGGK